MQSFKLCEGRRLILKSLLTCVTLNATICYDLGIGANKPDF